MAQRKKFGRPVQFEVDNDRPGSAVRAIKATREGGALEGAYASFSSQEAVRLQPYEAHRRSVISASVKAWFSVVFFWVAICLIVSTFVLGN